MTTARLSAVEMSSAKEKIRQRLNIRRQNECPSLLSIQKREPKQHRRPGQSITVNICKLDRDIESMMATVVLDIFKHGNMYSERNQEKDRFLSLCLSGSMYISAPNIRNDMKRCA
jgi:hypothetical protein